MRLIHAKLAAATSTWRDVAAEAKRRAYMAGGAIRRMLNRKLSMAWEKWQYEAAEMKRQQMLLKRGLMRMLKAKLAQALTKWRVEAEAIKAEKEAETLRLRAAHAHAGLFEHAVVPGVAPHRGPAAVKVVAPLLVRLRVSLVLVRHTGALARGLCAARCTSTARSGPVSTSGRASLRAVCCKRCC